MANLLMAILLGGTALLGSAHDQAVKPEILIAGPVYHPDGQVTGARALVTVGTAPSVWYISTGRTLCEAPAVSMTAPVVAGNGWKLTITPQARPANAPAGSVAFTAEWQRLWANGAALTQMPAKSIMLTLRPGSTVPLDTLDSGARIARRDAVDRLRAVNLSDPASVESAPELTADPLVAHYLSQIRRFEAGKTRMTSQEKLGSMHPRVQAVNAQIKAEQDDLRARASAIIAKVVAAAAADDAKATDGCGALSMNLQVGIEPAIRRDRF